MLTMHQVVDLIYSMGHTFDNLGSTYIATEEFLTTNNPTVLGSRNDLALCKTSRMQRKPCSTTIIPTASHVSLFAHSMPA